MPLLSKFFRGDKKLAAAQMSDPAHLVHGTVGPHTAKVQMALFAIDFPLDRSQGTEAPDLRSVHRQSRASLQEQTADHQPRLSEQAGRHRRQDDDHAAGSGYVEVGVVTWACGRVQDVVGRAERTCLRASSRRIGDAQPFDCRKNGSSRSSTGRSVSSAPSPSELHLRMAIQLQGTFRRPGTFCSSLASRSQWSSRKGSPILSTSRKRW